MTTTATVWVSDDGRVNYSRVGGITGIYRKTCELLIWCETDTLDMGQAIMEEHAIAAYSLHVRLHPDGDLAGGSREEFTVRPRVQLRQVRANKARTRFRIIVDELDVTGGTQP